MGMYNMNNQRHINRGWKKGTKINVILYNTSCTGQYISIIIIIKQAGQLFPTLLLFGPALGNTREITSTTHHVLHIIIYYCLLYKSDHSNKWCVGEEWWVPKISLQIPGPQPPAKQNATALNSNLFREQTVNTQSEKSQESRATFTGKHAQVREESTNRSVTRILLIDWGHCFEHVADSEYYKNDCMFACNSVTTKGPQDKERTKDNRWNTSSE